MEKRIPQLNNPITLHFYSQAEKLPADDDWKIVIVKTCDKKKTDFRIACYSDEDREWYDNHLSGIEKEDVIAWASFSPEWVLGVVL